MNCIKCGSLLPEGAGFCPECGLKIVPAESIPAPPPAPVENIVTTQHQPEFAAVQPESAAQPAVAVQSEPAAQPAVAVQPEPVAQPTVAVQPEPVAQPTVAVQPEPVAQPAPGIKMTTNPHASAPNPPATATRYPPEQPAYQPPDAPAYRPPVSQSPYQQTPQPAKRSPVMALLLVLLGLLFAAAVVFGVFQTISLTEANDQITRLDESSAEKDAEIKALSSENKDTADRLDVLQTSVAELNIQIDLLTEERSMDELLIQQLEDQITYYENDYTAPSASALSDEMAEEYWFYHNEACCIEDDGSTLYHRYYCPDFPGDYYWIFNTNKAIYEGYTACPTCWDILY